MQTLPKYFKDIDSCRLLRLHRPSHWWTPEYAYIITNMTLVQQNHDSMVHRATHAIEQAHACEAEGYYDVVY